MTQQLWGVWLTAPSVDIQIDTSGWCRDENNDPISFPSHVQAQAWIDSCELDVIEKASYSVKPLAEMVLTK